MGDIHPEVRDQHLSFYSSDEELLRPFLPHFSVTWARRRHAHNAELSVFFLKPDSQARETFGFPLEVLMVYSPFQVMQARVLQAAESFIFDEPGLGRVDQLVYLLVSEDPNVQTWVEEYLARNPESRSVVPFTAQALRAVSSDRWFVWRELAARLFERDLFDYRLPLRKDTYFFGREEIVRTFTHAIRLSENKGLFGLRKTGKTSIIYKLQRIFEEERDALFLYYDCKLTSIRLLRWYELLNRIATDIAKRSQQSFQPPSDERQTDMAFMTVVKRATKRRPVVVALDEIEFISPIAVLDKHWHADFVPFWQTFWACQSQYNRLSTIIAGVNAKVAEIDVVNGVQNPLFGLVSPHYVTGLGSHDIRLMLDGLGPRMGLLFDPTAVDYLYRRYGGHPLLTRISCSLVRTAVSRRNLRRPLNVAASFLQETEAERELDLAFYCRHAVSELALFYPDEYQMLEQLASGQLKEFMEFARFPEFTRHLEQYGLIAYDPKRLPFIAIPVVGRYVGMELARREGRSTVYKVVELPGRDTWLRQRLGTLVGDLRLLERLIRKNRGVMPYGVNSFPEADRLQEIRVCSVEGDFVAFINTMHRCFVESIDVYGVELKKKDFYWKDVQTAYPALWTALQRIRIYRNNAMHILLNPRVDEELERYLKVDLEGRMPTTVVDVWFILQQCILDALFGGVQAELNRFE